jgi:hypothetical protein
MKTRWKISGLLAISGILLAGYNLKAQKQNNSAPPSSSFDQVILQNSQQMINDGRQTFRFATYGDETFWGDTLQLHKAIEGAKFGGIGAGVSPATAAALGLKIDLDALPPSLVAKLRAGQVNLNDPGVTLSLLNLNSVLGVTVFFNPDGSLKSVGLQCALCHSRVDNSFSAPGIPPGVIGHRLDAWSNQDLNVGAIVASAPNLHPIADRMALRQRP